MTLKSPPLPRQLDKAALKRKISEARKIEKWADQLKKMEPVHSLSSPSKELTPSQVAARRLLDDLI